MSEQNQFQYAIGDWIVHRAYGPGQITDIEEKTLGGESKQYFRVQSENSTYWLSIHGNLDTVVRPLASPERIERALALLSEPATEMDRDYKVRRKRILEDSLDGHLRSDICLIRDLSARQQGKGLSVQDQESFKRLKNRFVQEWSLSSGISPQEAQNSLGQRLGKDDGKNLPIR